jgi:Flp pilus assembly protein TadD
LGRVFAGYVARPGAEAVHLAANAYLEGALLDDRPAYQRGGGALLGLALLALLVAVNLPGCQEEQYAALTQAVHYTGDTTCANCHKAISHSYHKTGMGRSWYRPSPQEQIEQFGRQHVVHDPHKDLSYWAYWEQDSLYIEEFRLHRGDTVHRRRERVDYIVGSGHQTRSYILARNGYLYEAPITWYVAKKAWDLSPGYSGGHNSRFSRPIGEECMACHNGPSGHVSGTLNRYRRVARGISCEQCHGPGSAHVEKMRAGKMVNVEDEIDYSIVNPAKLPVQKQFDVCQQCHLQGVNVHGPDTLDFRPGMRITQAREIFLEQKPDQNAFGIASHANRLKASPCFKGSDGELTCTTCHDPHEPINEKPREHYSTICQDCHGPQHEQPRCSAPMAQRRQRNYDCAACHMPKGNTSDIPHVNFTDHYIRVVDSSQQQQRPKPLPPEAVLRCMTSDDPGAHALGLAYLKFYEGNRQDRAFLDVAQQHLGGQNALATAKLYYFLGQYEQALTAAEQAITENPQDPWRYLQKGQILEALQRWQPALQAYAAAYKRQPGLVQAGLKREVMRLRAHPGRQSVLYKSRHKLQQLLQQQPWHEQLHMNLGFVELNLRHYAAARQHLQRALALRPDYGPALENLILLHLKQDRPQRARHYLTLLERRVPDYAQLEALQQRVRRQAGAS